LTIVSAGTSLPEVATSVAATLKGEKEIAIGNVVGSNIFNILAVLGISGMLSPTPLLADLPMQQIDIPVMILSALFVVVLAKTPGRFQKYLGVFFLVSYGAYVVELIGR
jgi:cation:H+ antiporter